MSWSRLGIVLVVFGLNTAFAHAIFAQGCTAARGCPTLPPSIPGGPAAAASRTPYGLINNFYASAEATSFEARPAAPNPADDVPANKALIRVSVPSEDALVLFQGVPSRQQGKERLFASPELAAGDYRYVIRCVWNDGDRRVSREQRILVRPGEETTVDFVAAR
jgi:uncharacterized protein (TIGR03000 family)